MTLQTAPSPCEFFWEEHVPRILTQYRDSGLTALDGAAEFHIEGGGGGTWTLAATRGRIEDVRRGSSEAPSAVITLSPETFIAIALGELDHRVAFFRGRIRIDGDLPLVLWAANLIPLLRKRFPFRLPVAEAGL